MRLVLRYKKRKKEKAYCMLGDMQCATETLFCWYDIFSKTTNIGKIETNFLLGITITPQPKKYERTNERQHS